MSQLKKAHTLTSRTSSNRDSSLQKSVPFADQRRNSNYFSPTLRCFIFCATAQPTTDKQSESLLRTLAGHCNLTLTTEARTANSVLPQLAVTCKVEAECSYQTFMQVDSEVLRNRQLRQHAKRYAPL